jgi:hypothetical protein
MARDVVPFEDSGDWWPEIVIATLSATPARRMLRIAERRSSSETSSGSG